MTALKALHLAICRQGPAPAVGGIGVALGTETVKLQGKSRKVVKVSQMATTGPAAQSGAVKVGDVILEVDGRDVTSLDVKSVKELTKGVTGSPLRLKLLRSGAAQEVVIRRSDLVSGSLPASSDAGSSAGGSVGVMPQGAAGREPSASERGKEGCEAAAALHEELEKLRAGVAAQTKELNETREELSKARDQGAAGEGKA
eukprot:552375-Hanusia_phi.AAC.1